jgi:myosin-5
VRSAVSVSPGSHQKLNSIDWNQQQGSKSETVSPEGQKPSEQIDVNLVLKLQQKLKDVEKERNRVQKTVEHLEKEDSPSDDAGRTHDSFKLQEMETENAKLKTDLAALRRLMAERETWGQELLKNLEASQLELDRRRQECIQLHSVLTNQTKGLKSVANNNYSSHVDIINKDGTDLRGSEENQQATGG